MKFDFLCNDCGSFLLKLKRNRNKKNKEVSTYYKGYCDLCKKYTTITESRDFGYPSMEKSDTITFMVEEGHTSSQIRCFAISIYDGWLAEDDKGCLYISKEQFAFSFKTKNKIISTKQATSLAKQFFLSFFNES